MGTQSSGPNAKQHGARRSRSAVRARILAAFWERARGVGIRSTAMSEVASDLRMSPLTIYKHFESKDMLVLAMVESWVGELEATAAANWAKVKDCRTALAMLSYWTDAWAAKLAEVSPVFLQDLRRDHPEAWKRLQEQRKLQKRIAATNVRRFMRKDIHGAAALFLLHRLMITASDPRFGSRFGMSRAEAIHAAIALWEEGAADRDAGHADPDASARD